MTWADMLSGVLAVLIFFYLLIALFWPEKF